MAFFRNYAKRYNQALIIQNFKYGRKVKPEKKKI